MSPREHAIIALCRMLGHSLDCGWRSFDDLSPEEMVDFAMNNVMPLRKTVLPILEAQFEKAMTEARP